MENENLKEKNVGSMENTTEKQAEVEMEIGMEEVVQQSVEEVPDSGITQLKYFFSSWTKYFKSIAVKPTFLLFFAVIFVLILVLTPFREAQKELTMDYTRVVLEEQFTTSTLYQDFSDDELDALVEQSLRTVGNMYSAPIFILSNILANVSYFLTTFVCILIVLKILKSTVTVKQMLAVTVGATVISAIETLVYGISISFTGSMTNIMSLGIFAIDAPISSVRYVFLNSISIATIITFIFYYYMSVHLAKYSKNKSLVLSFVLIIVPIIITVAPTLLVSALL